MRDNGLHNEPFSLSFDTVKFHETITRLRNIKHFDQTLYDEVEFLYQSLNDLLKLAPTFFEDKFEEDQSTLLHYIQWLLDDRIALNLLLTDSNNIEDTLAHLLDVMEEQIASSYNNFTDCNAVFVLIQNCTKLEHKLKQWLQMVKPIFDTGLEFHEISIDHIDTLDNLIEKSIQQCFSIQDDRFSSPVRHTPSFTLTQLVRLLETNNESSEPKVPSFSPVEGALYERYLKLKRSLDPIEMSLTEVLPRRIDYFKNRNVENIDFLHSILLQKYKRIMDKYRFMINEVRTLKLELIDRRWNILFISLNQELSFLLEEVDSLQKKLFENEFSKDTKDQLNKQLKTKSYTVTKTFNIIYKALEFSLLDAGVATKTNNMARKWLDIKPLNDQLLNKSLNFNEHDVERLTNHLEKLSMEEKPARNLIDEIKTPKKKVGAVLLKKMNIKPVIITGTPPASVEKINPFFDNKLREDSKNPNTAKSLLSEIPSLSYVANGKRGTNIEIDEKKTIQVDNTIDKAIEVLELKKIHYFSRQTSKIPTFKSKMPLLANSEIIPVLPPQAWTPYSKSGRQLKTPTPVSDLLSPLNYNNH